MFGYLANVPTVLAAQPPPPHGSILMHIMLFKPYINDDCCQWLARAYFDI